MLVAKCALNRASSNVLIDLLALLHLPLHRPSVRALGAEALPRAAGVSAPAALWLLQALGTRPQARTVLG